MFACRKQQIVAALVLLTLSACQATEPRTIADTSSVSSSSPAASRAASAAPDDAPTAVEPSAQASSPATAEPSTNVVVPPSDEWTTFQSADFGFEVDYPDNYTAEESVNEQGEKTVTFTPPGRGAAITVTAQPMTETQSSPPALVGCQPATVGGLAARRCINPADLSFTTYVEHGDVMYKIDAPGRGLRLDVYERLMSSFKVGS